MTRYNLNDLSQYDELLKEHEERKASGALRVRHPYVLYGCLKRRMVNGSPVITPALKMLNVSNAHGQVEKLERYQRKGYRVLDYWLPTVDDLPAEADFIESGWILRLRNKRDVYRPLEAKLKALKGEAGALHDLKKREDAVRQREQALNIQAEELEAKLKKEDTRNDKASTRANSKA